MRMTFCTDSEGLNHAVASLTFQAFDTPLQMTLSMLTAIQQVRSSLEQHLDTCNKLSVPESSKITMFNARQQSNSQFTCTP